MGIHLRLDIQIVAVAKSHHRHRLHRVIPLVIEGMTRHGPGVTQSDRPETDVAHIAQRKIRRDRLIERQAAIRHDPLHVVEKSRKTQKSLERRRKK